METKYIRDSKAGFFLWPRTLQDPVWHRHLAEFVKCRSGGTILSAGSVEFINGKPFCYGDSESLKIKSLPEDTELLCKQLNIKGEEE